MQLITYEDFELKVTEEALLLAPIRKLWKRDRSRDKEQFFAEMGYIYFMVNPASSYMYIPDEKERSDEIIRQEGLTKWKVDDLMTEAMSEYAKTVETPGSMLLREASITAGKIRKSLADLDFDSLDEKFKVGNIKTAASVLAMIPKIVKELAEAERAVLQEQKEASRPRGGASKTVFEDGIRL